MITLSNRARAIDERADYWFTVSKWPQDISRQANGIVFSGSADVVTSL